MDFPNLPPDEIFNGTTLSDTYHMFPGTGHDLIIEHDGTITAGITDTLLLGSGLTASTISVIGVNEGFGQYGLLISDIATGDSIELINQITGGQPQVEQMKFGATTIDLTIGIDM